MAEPAELVAGDSWSWSRPDLRDAWPASGSWVLTYRLRPAAGGTSVLLTADAAFAVAVAPAASALYAAGAWLWTAMVGNGTDRHTVGEGRITVRPDPAAATATDARSWAERTLEAVEAVLAGRATADHEAYSIEGRSVTRIPIAELRTWRARLKTEVARERGAPAIETVRVQFT